LRPGDALPARYEGASALPPYAPSLEELRRNVARYISQRDAFELFRLLRHWVSELEPEMVVDVSGELLGIGYGGDVVLPAYC
jgi:hypothetical protein